MKWIRKSLDKIILVIIMAITGFLNFYAIAKEGYGNQYYAAAVKSMLTSWHNFFFASLDAGGYVTVDKPAPGLWLQAASARVFGFHGWSLILPEALSAVISVAVLYHLVQRYFGKVAGLISALLLSLTPILIAVSRTNNLDSSLVLILLLSVLVLVKAAEKGSFKLLALSVGLVGLGFNIKMLQAFMVLPAIYITYFFTAPHKPLKRLLQLTGATAVLMAVSLSWAIIVDSIPADSRPYIGSSSTNSVLELALGYNGLQRLTGRQAGNTGGVRIAADAGNRFSSATQENTSGITETVDLASGPDMNSGAILPEGNGNMPAPPAGGDSGANGFNGADGQGSFRNRRSGDGGRPDGDGGFNGGGTGGFGGFNGGGPGGTGENGAKSLFRLFNENLSGQISWFLPMAFFGILVLTLEAFRKSSPNRKKLVRSLLLWSSWILPMIGFFSIAGFYHRYYLSMLAPAIAALSGIALVELRKAYMSSGWQWILLPGALLSTAAVQLLILSRVPEWGHVLIPVICVVLLPATGLLVGIRLLKKDDLDRTIKTAIAVSLAALLAAPALWSATPLLYGSQTVLPVAGPELNRGGGFGQDGGGFAGNFSGENAASSQLVQFLLSKKQNERWIVAVPDAGTAESIILETGETAMAVGGFSGSDNILTVEKLEELVAKGELRYFMLGGRGMGQQSDITAWVQEHGTAVNLDEAAPTDSTQNGGNSGGRGQFGGQMGTGTLYDLAPEKDAS